MFGWTVDVGVKLLRVEVIKLCDWLVGLTVSAIGLVWWVLGALKLDTIARVLAVVKYAAGWDGDIFEYAAF